MEKFLQKLVKHELINLILFLCEDNGIKKDIIRYYKEEIRTLN